MLLPFQPDREFEIEERCFIVEMLSVSDDPACSIARARVPPGITTRWHKLSGTVERYIILSGEGEVFLDMGSGAVHGQKVRALDTVCIAADRPQRIRNTCSDESLVFLCVCTPGFRPENYIALE